MESFDEKTTETSLPSSLTSSTSSTTTTLLYEPCILCLRKSKNFTCEMCLTRGDFSKSKPKHSEMSYCELQRKYENLKRLKVAFQTRIIEILEKRKDLYQMSEAVVLKKESIQCLHQILHNTKKPCRKDLIQLDSLRDSNLQRQKQIDVKTAKITKMCQVRDQYQAKLVQDKECLAKIFSKLSELRKRTISNTQQYLFPVEAIPVYPVMGTPSPHDLNVLDTSQDIEVDEVQTHESVESALADATQTSYVEGRWISKEDEVTIEYSIVDSSCVLRGNGDYSSYCQWVKTHRNGSRGPEEEVGMRNPAFTICAGLSHTAQFLELLAYYFDVILPKKLTYSEFCQSELNKSEFRSAVNRLNANILHFCFTQHIDPTLLYLDRPLYNLYALLNSSSVGRIGAFECHPEHLLLSLEQDKNQSDGSDMEDDVNSESDTDWETVPKSVDVNDVIPTGQNSLLTASMTLSNEELNQGAGSTASLVTSAAASVAALWPWKR